MFFFQCDQLLLPGFELTIKLQRNSNSWVLVTPDARDYKLVVHDIKLYLRHLTMTDSLISKHLALLDKQPAVYNINKTVLKIFPQPAGDTTILIPSLFDEVFPKCIIIGLLPSANFNGTRGTNPFHFKFFGFTEAAICVNGVYVPAEPYRPNWAAEQYIREYRDFLDNVGIGDRNMANMITPNLFKDGCSLLAFDLSPERCFGRHYHRKNTGNISLTMRFGVQLPSTVTVLAFGIYDSVVLIDKNNNITTDIGIS